MACDYAILSEAQVEIESIVSYLISVAGGSSAARAFMDEFDKKIALACDNPMLYCLSRMPEVAALGYRVFFVKSYVVLYFFRDDCIYVAHVFHRRQDYARLV